MKRVGGGGGDKRVGVNARSSAEVGYARKRPIKDHYACMIIVFSVVFHHPVTTVGGRRGRFVVGLAAASNKAFRSEYAKRKTVAENRKKCRRNLRQMKGE